MFFKRLAQSPPSTYSITMQRCLRDSKLQYMETTKGLSVNDIMSLSANTCSTWFLSIKLCLLIFFKANLWRVSLCLTKYTAPYAPLDISLVTSKSSSLGGFALNASPPVTDSPPVVESAPLVFSLSDPFGVELCWGSRLPSRFRSGLLDTLVESNWLRSSCNSASGSLLRPSLLMMYWGRWDCTPYFTLACPSAASNSW